jgi:hypothetical protein
LYVVVEGQAAQHRPRLEALHAEYCADLESTAPVRLEVLDRATHEALERLIAAGLIAPLTRAARSLDAAAVIPVSLSPEELARMEKHHDRAGRKLKMARILAAGGMVEETRAPLLEAILALGRAMSVESRQPEPGAIDELLRPPLLNLWGTHAACVRDFAVQPAADDRPVTAALAQILEDRTRTPF